MIETMEQLRQRLQKNKELKSLKNIKPRKLDLSHLMKYTKKPIGEPETPPAPKPVKLKKYQRDKIAGVVPTVKTKKPRRVKKVIEKEEQPAPVINIKKTDEAFEELKRFKISISK